MRKLALIIVVLIVLLPTATVQAQEKVTCKATTETWGQFVSSQTGVVLAPNPVAHAALSCSRGGFFGHLYGIKALNPTKSSPWSGETGGWVGYRREIGSFDLAGRVGIYIPFPNDHKSLGIGNARMTAGWNTKFAANTTLRASVDFDLQTPLWGFANTKSAFSIGPALTLNHQFNEQWSTFVTAGVWTFPAAGFLKPANGKSSQVKHATLGAKYQATGSLAFTASVTTVHGNVANPADKRVKFMPVFGATLSF